MGTLRFTTLVALLVLAASPIGADEAPIIPAGKDFGADLTLLRPTRLAEVVLTPERFEQRQLLLHGTLTDVCQRKGCWTILQDEDTQIRVRFRDYGFFLPTDAIGAEAYIEGVVKVETLSEQAARHYAAESRDGDPKSIQGPRREVGFTASGVRLVGME